VSALDTPFARRFGLKWPIVQTGMGWVSGARLTAATSDAGGLGVLGAATMTLGELDAAIGRIKARTDRPFGVNFRADQEDVDARVDRLVAAGVAVASFARAPSKEVVDRLHAGGLYVIATVGAPRHAEKVAKLGVDALIAQGGEGGGHTGVVPTALLVPAVVDAVDLPVLAAGGIRDGRGLVAALAWGAQGVAMGTRFLLTQESTVPDAVKARYLAAKIDGTTVTDAVDGAPQRVLQTDFVAALLRSGPVARLLRGARHALALRRYTGATVGGLLSEGLAMRDRHGLSAAQVVMAASAPALTRAALVDGDLDAGVLPAGQVVGLIDDLPTVEALLHRIGDEALVVLERLAAPPEVRRVG
jgi:NAD(P)H-dependent flavin oxidoreductase YrpB (nitropropane dioxygenase family)